jgi:hypothetical protein
MTIKKGDQALFNALTDYAVGQISERHSFLVPAMIRLLNGLQDHELQYRLETLIFQHFKTELREALAGIMAESRHD